MELPPPPPKTATAPTPGPAAPQQGVPQEPATPPKQEQAPAPKPPSSDNSAATSTMAAPAPAPKTAPAPSPAAAGQVEPKKPEGDGPGGPQQTRATVVDAMGNFYQAVDGTRPDRRRLEAMAQQYAGKEREMWAVISKANGGVLTEEMIDRALVKYDNPYSARKKKASGTDSGPGSGPNPTPSATVPAAAVPTNTTVSEAPSDPSASKSPSKSSSTSAAPAGVPVPVANRLPSGERAGVQPILDEFIYTAGDRSFDTAHRDVDRKANAEITALAMREADGAVDPAVAEAKRRKIEQRAESQHRTIKAYEATSLPMRPANAGIEEEADLPVDGLDVMADPRLDPVYEGASKNFLKLGGELQVAYDAFTEISQQLLSHPLGEDRHILVSHLGGYQMTKQDIRSGNFLFPDRDRFNELRDTGSGKYGYYTVGGEAMFAADVEDKLRHRMTGQGIELPETFYDYLATNVKDLAGRRGEVTDEIADFSRFDNPLAGMLLDVTDAYLTERLPADYALTTEERQYMQRRVMGIAQRAYTVDRAQSRAKELLAKQGVSLPDQGSVSKVIERIDEMEQVASLQLESMRQVAQGRIEVLQTELKGELAGFDQQVKQRMTSQQRNLNALVQTGQLSPGDAEAKWQELATDAMSQRNNLLQRRMAGLGKTAKGFEAEQTQVLADIRARVAEVYTASGLVESEDDGSLGVDEQLLATYQELVDQELQAAENAEHRRQQADYAGLNWEQKLDRGLDVGVLQMLESSGGTLSWLGQHELGFQLTHRALADMATMPLKDYGEFEFSDMVEGDWWMTNAVPLAPLAASFMIPGAGGAGLGRLAAGALNLGSKARFWTIAGSGAVAQGVVESLSEAGSRRNQSILMGKTPQRANRDASNVFKRNLVKSAANVFQMAAAMKLGKYINRGVKGFGMRKAINVGGGLVGSSGLEGLEEIYQGHASAIQDDANLTFLDYAMSPEGKYAGTLGVAIGMPMYLGMGGLSQLFAKNLTADELLQHGSGKPADIARRASEQLSSLELLRINGDIPPLEFEGIKARLNSSLKTALRAVGGKLPETMNAGGIANYTATLAEIAGLEVDLEVAEAAGELSEEQRERTNRQIQKLKDRAVQIERSDVDLTVARVGELPMEMDSLREYMANPEVVAALDLPSQLDVRGAPLARVELFSQMAKLETATIGATNASFVAASLDEAVLELSRNPDQVSGLSALYDRATANLSRGAERDGRKWKAVVQAIDQARAGQGSPVLRDALRREEAAGLKDTSSGVEGDQVSRASQAQARNEAPKAAPSTSSEPEPDADGADVGGGTGALVDGGLAAERADQEAKMNLTRAVDEVFFEVWTDEAARATVTAQDAGLADRVARAGNMDNVSLEDKILFNQIVRTERAQAGYRAASRSTARSTGDTTSVDNRQAGLRENARSRQQQTTDAETGVLQDEVGLSEAARKRNRKADRKLSSAEHRAELFAALEKDPEFWDALEAERPELYGRTYEDRGLATASSADVRALQEFLAEVESRLIPRHLRKDARPQDEYLAQQARRRTEETQGRFADLDKILSWGSGLIGKLSFVPGIRAKNSTDAFYAERELHFQRKAIKDNIRVVAINLILDGQVTNYAEFIEVLFDRLGQLKADRLELNSVREIWNKVKQDLRLRAENPLEFNSVLGASDQFVKHWVDARTGLKLFEQAIIKNGNPGADGLQDHRPSDLFTTLTSRVDHQVSLFMQKIKGTIPFSMPGSGAIDQASFFAEVERETGQGIAVLSQFWYALHAPDFNAQARKLGMDKYLQRAEELAGRVAHWKNEVADRQQRVDELEAAQAKALKEPGSRKRTVQGLSDARSSLTMAKKSLGKYQKDLGSLALNRDDNVYLNTAGSGMTDADAARIVEERGKLPTPTGETYDSVARRLYDKFRTNVIDARTQIAYDGGLISKDTYDNLMQRRRPVYSTDPVTGERARDAQGNYVVSFEDGFEYYVPLRVTQSAYNLSSGPERVGTGGPGGAGKGSAFTKAIEGTEMYSMLDRNNPIEQAIADYVETVRAVEHNAALQEVMSLEHANEDASVWRVVRSSARPVYDHQGYLTGMADNVSEEIKQNSVPVMVDGQLHYLYFRPVMNLEGDGYEPHPALIGLERRGMAHPGYGIPFVKQFLQLSRLAINLKRNFITKYNPFFGLSNIARDIVTVVTNVASADIGRAEKAKMAAKVVAYIPQAAVVLLAKGVYHKTGADKSTIKLINYLQDAIADGMPMSWANVLGVEQAEETSRKIARRRGRIDYAGGLVGSAKMRQKKQGWVADTQEAAKHNAAVVTAANIGTLLDTSLSHVNDALENTMRLAAYAAARDAGVPRTRAAAIGKNISANFEQKGTMTPWLNALYLFANAGIQGTYRDYQNLKTWPGRAAMAGYFTLGMVQGYLMADDEEYQDLTPYDRQSNWLVPRMFGSRLKAPKPYGMVRFFSNLGENMVRFHLGQDDVDTFMWSSATDLHSLFDPIGGSNANPVAAFTPSLFQFPVSYYMNENFMGQAFYQDWDRNAGAQDRVGDAPESFQQGTKWMYEQSGGVVNLAPALAWELLKDLGGGVMSEGMRIERFLANDDPAKNTRDVNPVTRRFYDTAGPKYHKKISILYQQLKQDKAFPPTPVELEQHRRLYSEIVAETERAYDQGYDPPLKWRSIKSLRRNYYKKFGVSLTVD